MKPLDVFLLLALGLALALLQAPEPGGALKIKKVIKDAAKLSKKYGYLLASRKHKLYAVPFPMPLPVFVKRQHIYTQVPIIPRYVQHPQPYGSPAASASAAAAAATPESAYYDPMAGMPTSATASTSAYYVAPTESGTRKRSKKGSSSLTSSSDSSSQDSSGPSMSDGSSSQGSAASAGKYLNQLASIIGQSVPIFGNAGNANRELLTKILNGQAKLIAPTSLISAIKGPSAALLKYQQADKSPSPDSIADPDSTKGGDAGSSSISSSSSSGGGGGGGGASSATSVAPESGKSNDDSSSSSASSDTAKPSASELHRSRYRLPYGAMRAPYGMMADPRRLAQMAAMMGMPMMPAPMAAAALMPRSPMAAAAASPYLAMFDSQTNQFDQMDPQSSEPSEMVVGPGQSAGDAAEQQMSSATDQQLLDRRRQLIKLALIKERQEAERLLESRLALARAKQINQLNAEGARNNPQAIQMMNLYRQQQQQLQQHQQAAQQLQQLRYLQLLQQQQLQQNTIDYQ